MRYALTDKEWSIIQPILPSKPRGIPRVDDRRVLNGIFWVLRSGAPWRDLPGCYGPYTTCYNRFNRWRKAGVRDDILNTVADAGEADVQMLDTTIVRVHQHGTRANRTARSNVGRSRGGPTTKIHALVDGKGLPVRLAISAGQDHASGLATDLLDGLGSRCLFLADRAYDSGAIREFVRMRGAWANIPPKRNRKQPICFCLRLYRDRNQVERLFNRIKHCRPVATRYKKLAASYLAFVKLASIRLWLRVYESTTLVPALIHPWSSQHNLSSRR